MHESKYMIDSWNVDMFFPTVTVLSIALSGTTWLICLSLNFFILPGFYSFAMIMALGVVLLIVPIVNHIGIFIAIRRHNRQVVDAVSGNNLSVIFRREKRAAIDMIIVTGVLLICLAPALAVDITQLFFPDRFDFLWLWSNSLVYVNSSINPVIYWVRKSDIKGAVKSMFSFWMLI